MEFALVLIIILSIIGGVSDINTIGEYAEENEELRRRLEEKEIK